MKNCCWKGEYRGVDIGDQPDEPDVVDAGVVVEGMG